jgi:hypothetical protein
MSLLNDAIYGMRAKVLMLTLRLPQIAVAKCHVVENCAFDNDDVK